jgi:hypothetical protein
MEFERDTRIDKYIDNIINTINKEDFDIPDLIKLKLDFLDLESLLENKYYPEKSPYYERRPLQELDKFLTSAYGLGKNKYSNILDKLSFIEQNLYHIKHSLNEYRILELSSQVFENKKILKLGLNIDAFIEKPSVLSFLDEAKKANKLYDDILENKIDILEKGLHLENLDKDEKNEEYNLYTKMYNGICIYKILNDNRNPVIKTKEYNFENSQDLKVFYHKDSYSMSSGLNPIYINDLFKKHFPQFFV